MKYNINSQYGGSVTRQKSTTDNPVTYIKVYYMTEGTDVTVHNIEEGCSIIWEF